MLGLSRTGNAKIRNDNNVYVVNDTTRNGERIKVLAQRGGIVILFSYARVRDSGGYKIVEGIYFLPVEDIRKLVVKEGKEEREEEKAVKPDEVEVQL